MTSNFGFQQGLLRFEVSALLDYMTSNSFEAHGNTDLAFVVRMLADRYQLRQLVEEVDSQLESQLSRENVLSFFGRLIGTNSLLEAKCLKMLELDGQRILEQQEATLDQITEERNKSTIITYYHHRPARWMYAIQI
jgi:hypothetical protein